MSFCLRCGTRLAVAEAAGRQRPVCPSCDWIQFRNPVPVTLALVVDRGRLLLVQRAVAPLDGFWAPPGGYVEWDESVEAALVREVREETGLLVAPQGVAAVHSAAHRGIVFLAYWAAVTGGRLQPGDDAASVAFVPVGQWPAAPRPVGDNPLEVWFHAVLQDLFRKVESHLGHAV